MFPIGAPMERVAHLQSLFHLSSRVPNRGAHSPCSIHRAPIDRETLQFQSPFQPSPKSPVVKPTSGCSAEPPPEERCPSSESSFRKLHGTQEMIPPTRFPQQRSYRQGCTLATALL